MGKHTRKKNLTKVLSTKAARLSQAVTTPDHGTGIPFGVRTDIEVSNGACLSVPMHTDAPVYQWLAAKRQQLEQGIMLRRANVRRNALFARRLLSQCAPVEETGKPKGEGYWVGIPTDLYNFTCAAVELACMEAELRRLGIAPEFSGITQEVWDAFHNETVLAQKRAMQGEEDEDLDEDEDAEGDS